MTLNEMWEKVKKADKKSGWTAALPYFLIYCSLMFAQCFGNGLYTGFVDALKGVGGEAFNSMMQTGQLHVDPTSWLNLGNIAKLLVPIVILGGTTIGIPAWAAIGCAKEIKDLYKTIGIEMERMQELSKIPDMEKSRANDKGRHYYLSYDNELQRLYRGPDLNGHLYVSEGIESIGECAFDDFLMYDKEKDTIRFKEDIKAIVLPSTIKKLDIDKIPDSTILIFTDAKSKSILRGSEDDLENREIKIKGGLFSDVLKECETLEHKKYDDEVPSILKKSDVDRINAAFSKITEPSLKIELMDKFHALILSGDLSIPNFKYLLKKVNLNLEQKKRYRGEDVIEKIYGSVEDAYGKFESKYYESENIRTQEKEAATQRTKARITGIKQNRTSAKNIFKTIEFVESVAKDPTAFLADKGRKLEKPNNVNQLPAGQSPGVCNCPPVPTA